jgi:Domain of unknown function (DUF4407)
MKINQDDNAFVKFALVCSGANPDTINDQQCASEKTKYVMIGTFICLTAIFAALSGGYALYMGFKSVWLAVPIGLLWGAFIFTVDRFIVSTIRKQQIDSDMPLARKVFLWMGDALKASPRILLAALISIVISTPLELKYFEPEIQIQIDGRLEKDAVRIRNEALQDQDAVKQRESENQRLRAEMAEKEKRRDQLQDQLAAEAQGRRGTGIYGPGPVTALLKEQFEQYQVQLKEFRDQVSKSSNENKQAIDELLATRNERAERLIKKQEDAVGFLDRFETMNDLAAKRPTIWWAKIFISFLILVLECTPIFMKLLGSYGTYDSVLEAEEYKVILKQRRLISDLNQKNNHELYFDERVQMLIRTAEEQWTRETISNIKNLAQNEIAEATETVARKMVDYWRDKATQDIYFHSPEENHTNKTQ